MKIDVNVKLYLDGNNEAKTEEELKAILETIRKGDSFGK